MRVLHLHCGQPGQGARATVDAERSCPGSDIEIIEISLSAEGVNYDDLVDEVFRADKVISWPG